MKQAPGETVVQFLRYSGDSHDHSLAAIERFSPRQWERALQWLDDESLAFYFLQKLKDVHAVDRIPDSILGRLQQKFASNQLRVEDMSRRFDILNQKFNDAGFRYAVVKGVSLVPEFCPYAPLRHQGDFDYLLDDKSLTAARQVLLEAGYVPKKSLSSVEEIFVIPGGKPSRGAEQYSARAPHAVELHTDIWDSVLHGLPQIPQIFFLDRTITKLWNGLAFPALVEEDEFVLQVLHACHHLFGLWIRISSLFEIGHFLNRRAHDEEFWNRIEQRVGDSSILREFFVIVIGLVSNLFASPVPPLVRAWAGKIRPACRVWIEHYARRCAFSAPPAYQFRLLPTSKLILFLHQQFREDALVGKSVVRRRLIPRNRLLLMVSSIRQDPSLALKLSWWKRHLLVRRSIFHLLAGLRYLLEVPRWRWLNRTKVSLAP